jgi:ribosomal protein S18 acetylase RimI-like enzyme
MVSMTRYLIRKATLEDANGVADCLISAFEPYRAAYTREAFSDTVPSVSEIRRRLVEMELFVAVSDGRVVGTVGFKLVDKEEGHLRGMAVHPEHQGRAVAQLLLDTVEGEIRQRQCSRISLDTTEPLKRAISFYEKAGFRFSGRVGDFFGMPLFEYIKVLT